jgi:hypothetical protein
MAPVGRNEVPDSAQGLKMPSQRGVKGDRRRNSSPLDSCTMVIRVVKGHGISIPRSLTRSNGPSAVPMFAANGL